MNFEKPIQSANAIIELKDIVAKLRSPKEGCPWDIEQTHLSLIPYLLEEAYEVADAIRHKNEENLKEELGDLLLQVVLHAQIAEEGQRFCLEDIAKSISQKLIRRHPHVFGNQKANNIEEVRKIWESIKIKEKKLDTPKQSISDDLKKRIRSQSAISGSMQISQTITKLGFESNNFECIWEKVNKQLIDLKETLETKKVTHAEEKLGDLLFTLITISNHNKINPEEALARSNKRFLERFSFIESTLAKEISKYSLKELREIWKISKESISQS
ncbi:nucleoside triphosphate pyrophosphohydrolase [Prochlorococcus sp. MIT 1307]|uniref:nucleoside triphosphate pyrophosphohydrolase n=1 Tax=Prochlorococcus sp. MIT 1307 TaxID=3096219 RepID=UPI002A754562|nr:nucleoside triphosphate pyrophosphohydrolase [Prochlorococcus sp. MIT 1307]